MKNFVSFVIVALVLGFGGYFVYRVYYRGESPETVVQEMTWETAVADHLTAGKEAYRRKEFHVAAKEWETARIAHDSGEPGATLDEEAHANLLIQLGGCYTRLWEEGGQKDDSLRRKALECYDRYLEEYPDSKSRRRILGRANDLRR